MIWPERSCLRLVTPISTFQRTVTQAAQETRSRAIRRASISPISRRTRHDGTHVQVANICANVALPLSRPSLSSPMDDNAGGQVRSGLPSQDANRMPRSDIRPTSGEQPDCSEPFRKTGCRLMGLPAYPRSLAVSAASHSAASR